MFNDKKILYGHNINNNINVNNNCKSAKLQNEIFMFRALKAKKDLELTDCVAEVDKFTACSDEGKERFAMQRIRFFRLLKHKTQAQQMVGYWC